MIRFKGKQQSRRRHPVEQNEKNRMYTYRSRRTEEGDTPQAPPRDTKQQNGRLADLFRSVSFIAGLLALLVLFAYATALGTESKVRFDGDQGALRPTKQYQGKADEILGQSLNNRWKLSINRSDIAYALKQSFPEISSVSISTLPWSYQPIVNISVSEPALVLVNGGSKYLVSDSGVAMINLNNTDNRYKPGDLPEVTDETGYVAEEGKYILSSEQVDFIKEIIYQAAQKKLDTDKVSLKPGGEEVDFKFKGLNYIVKFSFENDARKSAGAFLALKKHLQKNGPLPNQYIDARVPERAYVR